MASDELVTAGVAPKQDAGAGVTAPEREPTPDMGAAPGTPADIIGRMVIHPGPLVKGIPGFVFTVPQGWVLDEAPDALAVVRTPEQVDGFWVNAILSHDRVPRSVDFKQAAATTWARIQASSPDATITMERMARFGTNILYLRGVELKAPQSGRDLAQLHALFFAPATDKGKTVDAFQLVATAPVELMNRFGPGFMEIIGSFRFTGV